MTEIHSEQMPESLTLLIVDDDEVMRMYLEKLLSPTYNVILAENGVEAWDILTERESEIEVVLTDLQMPRLDGMDLLKRIKTSYEDKCVIVLSGSEDISLAVQAIRKGADDYLPKPFSNPEELEIIIWRWLQKQSLASKLSEYAALHKEMSRNMQSRTFMALDVVKSRDLKKYEDPFIVQFSFSEYHNFVAEIVDRHEGMIHNTAGDGVMTSFTHPENAVSAARELLDELGGFNRVRNQLSRDFSIRNGIHTGLVIVGQNGQISEMFSETLDIAGHIQKDAEANCITVSEVTRASLSSMDDLILTATAVAGLRVFSYRRQV